MSFIEDAIQNKLIFLNFRLDKGKLNILDTNVFCLKEPAPELHSRAAPSVEAHPDT